VTAAHIAITAAFAALLIATARSIAHDLTRPLVTVPRDEPEWDFTPHNPGGW
jgi:hypothetical protein